MQTGMRRGLHLHANLYLLLILRNDIVYATVCINICIRLCLYNCSCLCRNLRVVLTRRHLCMHHQTSAYAIDWSMKSTTTINSQPFFVCVSQTLGNSCATQMPGGTHRLMMWWLSLRCNRSARWATVAMMEVGDHAIHPQPPTAVHTNQTNTPMAHKVGQLSRNMS